MPKPKRPIQLSELQLAVLRVLWTRGEATTAEVAAELGAQRRLAHTTVATLLTRLEKRGLLAQRREGRALSYRARVSEGEVQSSMVASLVSALFQGDANALVAHLLRDEESEAGDIAKLRARLKRPGRG